MLNQQQLHAFAQKLQCTLPGIQAMQILTTDGLALLSDTAEQDEDRLSALSAMLFNAACQLAHSINRDETPKGVIISCDAHDGRLHAWPTDSRRNGAALATANRFRLDQRPCKSFTDGTLKRQYLLPG